MFLQGDLQRVFDALFYLGVIDPVLQKDWGQAADSYLSYAEQLQQAIQVVNDTPGDCGHLMARLETFDEEVLEYLAMEVAREYASFHSRSDDLH